jgi:hypothetical protein
VTLLEDLEAAAREIDCPVSDLCTADDPCTRRPLAASLRKHAARLRYEYKQGAAPLLLERINGGEIK